MINGQLLLDLHIMFHYFADMRAMMIIATPENSLDII